MLLSSPSFEVAQFCARPLVPRLSGSVRPAGAPFCARPLVSGSARPVRWCGLSARRWSVCAPVSVAAAAGRLNKSAPSGDAAELTLHNRPSPGAATQIRTRQPAATGHGSDRRIQVTGQLAGRGRSRVRLADTGHGSAGRAGPVTGQAGAQVPLLTRLRPAGRTVRTVTRVGWIDPG